MSRTRKILRRSFLIGSAAIVGGVAFGAYMVRKPHENPIAIGPGEASFNPWVKISDKGITLITPHPDLGQGARSVQALLIAEEMDIELDQFDTDAGVPAPAYYNRALADESVPFASNDKRLLVEAMRGGMGGLLKIMGMQLTGGSTTVPDSFDKLREAGAMARETLKAAAAARTGIDANDLRTERAAVITPDGMRIDYVDLAAEAALLDPVIPAALRDPSTWRLIGKPTQRIDILAKSTGTQDYGIDMRLDGMVHATLRCNPYKGGAMTGFDATEALKMRGVKAVVPVSGGVCVMADNTWRAFRAAEAVAIDWAPGDYPAEQQAHWDRLSASFDPEFLDLDWRVDGDPAAALEEGRQIEAEYRAPYVAHQPLEPLTATVLVADARVDVWTSHQIPRVLVDRVAAITGVAAENVHLHNLFAGGSFGHRLEFDYVDRTAEAAAQMKGVPVKMTLRREEDFLQNIPRQIGMARARGAVRDGRITALDLGIASPSVVRSQAQRLGQSVPGPDTQIAAGAWAMPYDLPALRVSAYAATGLSPVSSWRSVGASTAGFFAEGFLDELIHEAGLDPMEERLRLINDDVARKVLEAAAEMSNWGSALPEGQGRGVALVTSFGVPVAEVVEVRQTDAGLRIEQVFIAADVGRVIDPVNLESQLMGGAIWGLGHAMNSEITYAAGAAEQDNYHMAEGMRFHQSPRVTVRALENAAEIRGAGEPAVPPAAPALANAIFAATGIRLREMPFHNLVDFA